MTGRATESIRGQGALDSPELTTCQFCPADGALSQGVLVRLVGGRSGQESFDVVAPFTWVHSANIPEHSPCAVRYTRG